MQTLLQDLRFGIRTLLKSPGFTLIVLVTLSLGVGANTAVFSVVHGVLLKPLPYKDAERIVVANISPPDFRDLKESTQLFDRMAIWASNIYNVTINGETTQARGAVVSPDFLPMLSQPALGRFWRPDEDLQPLAVISYDYWQTMFGGSTDVLGKTLNLYGRPQTIVGVAPPEFQYPSREFKIWNSLGAAMSQSPQQMENRQFRIFRAVAHLKPGVTIGQMRAEVEGLSQRLQRQYPDTNSGVQINFRTLYDRIVGDVQRALWVLLATVGLVLLIACANVANLSLSRLATREREIAIRTALGAGRWRVARQLLTESLLLAAVGGAAGLTLATWGLDALVALNPGDIPRLVSVRINTPALMFTLAASVLTGLIFGLVPAWQATRANLNQTLREGGRGSAGSAKGNRLRGALVVAEVALSLVTLIGAGLLIKSFNRLLHVDAGFTAENVLTVNVPMVAIKDDQQRANLTREFISRVADVPGVLSVGGASALPPVSAQRATRFAVQGASNDGGGARSAYFIAVTPDYFRALRTPLAEGRPFTERDNSGASKVLIINRTLAGALYPNGSAIGKRLQIINSEQSNEWREIVGVVGDVRYSGLDDPGEAAIYTPFAQTPFLWSNLIIRTNVPPLTLVHSVRAAIVSAESTLLPANFVTMDQLIYDSVAQPRFNTMLLAAFAALALALSAVGIYGVIAYSVTQRAHEIGVRMALGARKGDVLRLVLRQGMAPALVGAALGLVGAWGATRLMAGLLFDVTATDPVTFGAVTALLLGIALLACYIPARRATKVDPMVALRRE